MTEEQAREAAMQLAWERWEDGWTTDEQYDTVWDAALEYANRWTYCEDALPEESFTRLLVSLKNGAVFEATYFENAFRTTWRTPERVSDNNPVIAWRPLPKAAKIQHAGPQEQVEVS